MSYRGLWLSRTNSYDCGTQLNYNALTLILLIQGSLPLWRLTVVTNEQTSAYAIGIINDGLECKLSLKLIKYY